MIRFVTTPLLAAHLIAVSVGTFGPLLCLYYARRARRGDEFADRFGRLLARRSMEALVLGMLLGFLQLAWLVWGVQSGYSQALASIETSRWWFAGIEYVFSFTCVLVYWLTWRRGLRRPWLHGALAIIGATNLAYHFPTLFVIVGVVSGRPDLWETTVTVRTMLRDGEVLARVAHFVVAGIALAGGFAMWQAQRIARGESDARLADSSIVAAGRVTLAAILAQLPLGIVVLLQMSRASRQDLMGSDAVAASLLGAAVFASLGLLHVLGTIALGDVERPQITRAALLLVVAMLLMTATRQRTRHDELDAKLAGVPQKILPASHPFDR